MIARVLLIDGDERTRKEYPQFLRSAGFDVIAVSNGHGAVALALASGADVVVTDASPQGAIDGIEVTRRLRNDDRTHDVPILVLTPMRDAEARAQARVVGCNAILERPCEPKLLASEIRRLVAERPGKRVGRRNGADSEGAKRQQGT